MKTKTKKPWSFQNGSSILMPASPTRAFSAKEEKQFRRKVKLTENTTINSIHFNRPIDGLSDNVIVSTLGIICQKAAAARAGDSVDTGLVLLRLLKENGFLVTLPKKE